MKTDFVLAVGCSPKELNQKLLTTVRVLPLLANNPASLKGLTIEAIPC